MWTRSVGVFGFDTGLLVWSGLKCPFSESPERFTSEMGS